MDRILRIDKPKTLQGLLCFFNLYHSYKYWNHNRKNEKYAHIRNCTHCNKLQRKTWYQAGDDLIAYPWKKINKI